MRPLGLGGNKSIALTDISLLTSRSRSKYTMQCIAFLRFHEVRRRVSPEPPQRQGSHRTLNSEVRQGARYSSTLRLSRPQFGLPFFIYYPRYTQYESSLYALTFLNPQDYSSRATPDHARVFYIHLTDSSFLVGYKLPQGSSCILG
jgi:hypothetical protein